MKPEGLVDFEFPTREDMANMKARGRNARLSGLTCEPSPIYFNSIQIYLENGESKEFHVTKEGVTGSEVNKEYEPPMYAMQTYSRVELSGLSE